MKLEGISPKDLLINGFDFYKKHKLGVEFQCVLSDKLIEKLESMGIKKTWGHEGSVDTYATFKCDNELLTQDFGKTFVSVYANREMSDKEIENYIQARRLTNGLFTKDQYGDRVVLKNMAPNEINIVATALGATQKADYFANKKDTSPYSVHYFNDEKKEILYVIPNMQNVDSVSSNISTPPRVWSETLLDGLTNWKDISGDIKVKVYDEETLGAVEESLGKEIIKHFDIKYNKKDDRYETSFGQKTIKGIGAMAVNLLREQDLLNFSLENIDTENMPQEQAKRLGNIFIDRFNLTLKNNSNWGTKRVETSFGTKQPEGVGKMVLNLYCEQISSKMIDIAPPSQDNLPPARPIEECVADIEEMDKKAKVKMPSL